MSACVCECEHENKLVMELSPISVIDGQRMIKEAFQLAKSTHNQQGQISSLPVLHCLLQSKVAAAAAAAAIHSNSTKVEQSERKRERDRTSVLAVPK